MKDLVIILMWLKTTNWPGENGKHTTYKNGDLIMNGF